MQNLDCGMGGGRDGGSRIYMHYILSEVKYIYWTELQEVHFNIPIELSRVTMEKTYTPQQFLSNIKIGSKDWKKTIYLKLNVRVLFYACLELKLNVQEVLSDFE